MALPDAHFAEHQEEQGFIVTAPHIHFCQPLIKYRKLFIPYHHETVYKVHTDTVYNA